MPRIFCSAREFSARHPGIDPEQRHHGMTEYSKAGVANLQPLQPAPFS